MITFGDFGNAGNSSTFDISFDDEDANDTHNSNIALNYTYSINGSWMVGASYSNEQSTTVNSTGTGVHGYYNLDGQTVDTCFAGLHYDMMDPKGDDNNSTTIALEYGHRFSVGSWNRFHLAFSPSVSYAMTTTETATDDVKSNALAWNFIKFDVLF
jgi:hypothetical protein